MSNRLINTSEYGVRPSPPMSNTERQREFRKRHPHYYRDYHRRRAAEAAAYVAAKEAEKVAAQQAQAAIENTTAAPPFVWDLLAQPAQLCLPAPGQTANAPVVLTLPTTAHSPHVCH